MGMDSLGDRIKRYERVANFRFTPRSCLFIRVDGKSFHTYTRNCVRPFDRSIVTAMQEAALVTTKQMSGFKAAYIQSDECTFMLTDFDNLNTQGWFDYELNKVVSITASAFTAGFNDAILATDMGEGLLPSALFDARAFVVPVDDAPNVFLWRQKDWKRNSIQMLARSLYLQKEVHGKKIEELLQMIRDKGSDWNNLSEVYRNGTYLFGNEQVTNRHFDYQSLKERIWSTHE